MKNLTICFVFLLSIFGCSEGDIIETEVDFEAPVQSCGNTNTNTYVFYKIDNTTNQLLSFNFTNTNFSLIRAFEEPVSIPLNTTTNRLLYRELSATINGDSYFCSSVPPSDLNVAREFVSENGIALISYEKVEGTDNDYIRTVTLQNITLAGNGISLRKEVFLLGSEQFTLPDAD